MMHDEIVTYEVAKLAKEKGFDVYCDYTYYNHYRVRDEIKIKHLGLSDDGYEDLRKIYGGPYSDNELYGYYIEALELHSKNSTIGIHPITKSPCATDAICSAPTQSLLQRWLREEKGVVFGISPMQVMDCEDLGWCATIYKVDENGYGLSWQEELYYDTYELVLENALKYALENLV